MCLGILELWSLNAIWWCSLFFKSSNSWRLTLWVHAFPCSSPPYSCIFKIKELVLHSQLGLAWFLPQMLRLAPFPACIQIQCLTRHRKPVTFIRAATNKMDLFSYPCVNHETHPKVRVTNFSYPNQNYP